MIGVRPSPSDALKFSVTLANLECVYRLIEAQSVTTSESASLICSCVSRVDEATSK